ncbi:MAG: hypothetical protein EAZ74_01795 [Alphaproteobacteria bacterium]|nr:MAG: hypothetical protein EAY76_01840 [Alphaproteobacteria bacterium]TAF15423.1 MAG: hypothetical protein EAZ74_01795 [Alphaproteobacteria bacterium]TAF75681.1 MAG: hypothetical protein EAZ52_06395 [Alphaproteobacteria bacterium]
MNELIIMLVLDSGVALLLGATIYFCTKLNKRVKQLQDSKSELAMLIQQFDESTRLATVSITEIQRASKKINENIEAKLQKANYLADDLASMIERASKTADRIENQISNGRSAVSSSIKPSASDIRAAREERTQSDATAQPLRQPHARSNASARSGRSSTPQDVSGSERKSGGLEAMIERMSELRGTNGSDAPAPKKEMRPMARMRSQSEQDLIAGLRADERR